MIDSVGQMIQNPEKRMSQRMEEKIAESEHSMKLYMEVNAEKRMDALFDGCKLTHEKQWELEHETQRIKGQISSLETRPRALEKELSA